MRNLRRGGIAAVVSLAVLAGVVDAAAAAWDVRNDTNMSLRLMIDTEGAPGAPRETRCVPPRQIDGPHRYPMDVGQDGMAPMVMKLNVANLCDYVTGAGMHARR